MPELRRPPSGISKICQHIRSNPTAHSVPYGSDWKKKRPKKGSKSKKKVQIRSFSNTPPIDLDSVKGGGWVGKGGENSRFAFGSDTKHLCGGGCRETSHDFTFVHTPFCTCKCPVYHTNWPATVHILCLAEVFLTGSLRKVITLPLLI